MASIDDNLETIRTAIYGKDMRQAIYESFRYLSDMSEISAYIKSAFAGVFPEIPVMNTIENVTTSSTLYGQTPYFLLNKGEFDCTIDGLLVWKNTRQLIPKAYYTFDTGSVNGKVKIDFNLPLFFNDGDTVLFSVYRKSDSPIVPSDYEVMDYYLFSGSQAINTGFTPTNGVLKVETALKYPAYCAPGMGSNFLIGGFNSSPTSYGSHSFQFFLSSGGQLEAALMDGGYTTHIAESTVLSLNTEYEITATFTSSLITLDVNGTTYTAANASEITVPQREVWIGANGDPNVGGDVGYAMMNVNYLKLYDGSELVRDLVPVVRTSDNKAGFYDLVTENFYYS